jgi:hypothetical protein
MMPDTSAAARLRRFAQRSQALHAEYLDDPALRQQYEAFVCWLNDYMMAFYADLRPRPGYGAALDFVITDLTGTGISRRDADLARVVPVMARMLPGRALETLATAMELNARVLQMNLAICRALFAGRNDTAISERDLCQAYRRAVTLETCLELSALTRRVGDKLQRAVRSRALGLMLKAMHGPAHAAGFGALHDFLQTGYVRFEAIADVPGFLDQLESRMTHILTRIFTEPLDSLSLERTPLETRHDR